MAFTIHGLDEDIEAKLTERARREGTSKNKLVKTLLARALGISRKEDDTYREFLGLWTEDDLKAFEERQKENNQIDPGDWQ